MEIVNRILSKMSRVSKPQQTFLRILFSTMMYIPSRVNFRNLSRYSELSEMTYLRNFRKEFAFNQFNHLLIKEALPAHHRKIGALDCSYLAKSGKKTYGLDYFFSGQAGGPKRGLEISQLAIIDVDELFAYRLSTEQTPPTTEIGPGEENRIEVYLKQLADNQTLLQQQGISHIAVDGFYAKKRFIDGARKLGFHLIGKLRTDANLRYLYEGPQKGGPGAPKRYDGKVYYDDFSRWQKITGDGHKILYSARLNAPRFKRNLRVICLLDQTDPEKPKHSLFFSTDIHLDPIELFTDYKARFQIEFLFRDGKQFTGLKDGQARNKQALLFHFNAALTTLNLLRMQDRQGHYNPQQAACSIASWKARLYNEHLLNRFIQYLDLPPDLVINHPRYQELRNYGAIAA